MLYYLKVKLHKHLVFVMSYNLEMIYYCGDNNTRNDKYTHYLTVEYRMPYSDVSRLPSTGDRDRKLLLISTWLIAHFDQVRYTVSVKPLYLIWYVQADFGDPLVVCEDSCTLVGMFAGSYGCADDHYPGFYTDIGSFNDWIVNKTTSTKWQQTHYVQLQL